MLLYQKKSIILHGFNTSTDGRLLKAKSTSTYLAQQNNKKVSRFPSDSFINFHVYTHNSINLGTITNK